LIFGLETRLVVEGRYDLRTFIAIELPAPIRSQIHQQQQALAQALDDPPIRWVRPESIHLTLKFLGEISTQKAQQIDAALPYEVRQYPPARVQVQGLGCFPNFKRPRVVWIGLETQRAVLSALQAHLENWLQTLGFQPEKRGFSPHLTIGRIHRRVNNRQRKNLGDQIRGHKAPLLGEFTAESVHLLKSDLRPSGAVYTRLATARLGGADE
jgi:2'-5' RNA ligase